jgi:hypothetical protein
MQRHFTGKFHPQHPPFDSKKTEKDAWGVVAGFFVKILLYAQLRSEFSRAFGAEHKEHKL